jgi:2,3-bisphosphoglycerate-independent phosphoglycerate mutase
MATILTILDGFGLATTNPNNCNALAKTPTLDSWFETYPFTTLNADGVSVGQEDGLVGNSEVGHMNLGGLQMVKQLSYQITESAKQDFRLSKDFPDQILDPLVYFKDTKKMHLVGLFSTGSIHSDLRHWTGAIKASIKAGANSIVLHLITDGRDSDRKSFLATLTSYINSLEFDTSSIRIGSIGGRVYAMDRDTNYDKVMYGLKAIFGKNADQVLDGFEERYQIAKTLDPIYSNQKIALKDAVELLSPIVDKNYQNIIFDEFLTPTSFEGVDINDDIWLINFRADRTRQMVSLISEMVEFKGRLLATNDYGSITNQKYQYLFKSQEVNNTLSQKIASLGKTQLHIAETEKYNHVTYFFNGGTNTKQQGEDWILIPSNKLANHSDKPEMKAQEITDAILANCDKYDFIIVNYANPDMVGHCGDIKKGIESMEFLDSQLARLNSLVNKGHKLIVTADHGNIEFVGPYIHNSQDLTDTEHNPNPVPLILIDKNISQQLNHKKLIDRIKELDIEINTQLLTQVVINMSTNKQYFAGQSWFSKVPLTHLPLWYSGVFCLVV